MEKKIEEEAQKKIDKLQIINIEQLDQSKGES